MKAHGYETYMVESSFQATSKSWKLRIWHLVQSNAKNVFLTCLLKWKWYLYLNRYTMAAEPAISFFILYDYSHSCVPEWHSSSDSLFSLSFFSGDDFFFEWNIFQQRRKSEAIQHPYSYLSFRCSFFISVS